MFVQNIFSYKIKLKNCKKNVDILSYFCYTIIKRGLGVQGSRVQLTADPLRMALRPSHKTQTLI